MKKNILLIENLDAISNSITFNLQKQGYSVLSKKTISTGKDVFPGYKISLIIIDNNLIITSVREHLTIPDGYHSIPLIILVDEKRNFIEKEFWGNVTLLVKPFSSAKLLNTIQNILG